MARKETTLVVGVAELRDMLRNYAPNEARNIIRQTVHGIAAEVAKGVRSRVKQRGKRLLKSIKVVRRRGEPNAPRSDVRAGSTAPYAIMLEYGTSKTKAQPYVGPTVEEFRPRMPEIMKRQFVEKLVKSIARRAKREAMK